MTNNEDFFERLGTAFESTVSEDSPRREKRAIQELNLDSNLHMQGTIKCRRWSQSDETFWAASDTVETLSAGFYKCVEIHNIGSALLKFSIPIDNLIKFPDSVMDEILEEFTTFLSLKPRFEERGFLFKRGMLFWGPPGSGKTALIMLIAHELIERNGIIIQIENPSLAANCLSMLRKIEPNRPVVAIMEDLDSLIERYGESSFLSLLDGETQVDNIIYVATTNYPEKLDKRLVDRPSRFDTVKFIGMPNSASRRVYLEAKEPSLSERDINEWVYASEGFSIAHLRELIILVKCYGHSLSAGVKRLRAMSIKPSSEDSPHRMKMGITT
jgi:Cdc6-like AAA superfamily ATPase